jgi:hypothetical protein
VRRRAFGFLVGLAVLVVAGPWIVRYADWILAPLGLVVGLVALDRLLRLGARWEQKQRARAYLEIYPDDAWAVASILMARDLGLPVTAREACAMLSGQMPSDAELAEYGYRWDRAWQAIG